MKKSLNKYWLGPGLASLLLTAGSGLYAQSYTNDDYAVQFLGNVSDPVTTTAGVWPTAAWNHIANTTFTTGSITSISGSQTATLTLSGPGCNRGWSDIGGNGGDSSLNNGYIDCGWTSSAQYAIVTVSGLAPNQLFNVYLYAFGNATMPQENSVWLGAYAVNQVTNWVALLGQTAGSPPLMANGAAPPASEPWTVTGYVACTNFGYNFNTGVPNASQFGDYLLFSNIPATSGQIVIVVDADGLVGRSPLNGFELIAQAAAPYNEPAPTNVVATGMTGAIKVTWKDASSGDATNYIVSRSTTTGTGYIAIATNIGNASTSYTDSNVTPYVTYYYVVQAKGQGTSLISAQASAAAVGLQVAPTGLAASSLNGAAGLVWYPSVSASGYQVLRATSNPGNQASYSVIGSPTMSIYTNTGLANGTTYYYEVIAVNSFGNSPASAYVSATPGVPNAGISLHDGGVFSTDLVLSATNINMNFSVTPGANTLVAALLDHNANDTVNGSPSFIIWSNATLGTTQILTRAVSQNQENYTYEDCDLFYLWNPSPGAGVLSATDTFNSGSTSDCLLLQVYSLSGVDTTNFNGGVPYTASVGENEAASLQVTTPGNTVNGSLAAVMSVNYEGGGGNFDTNTASSGTPYDFNFQVNGNQNNLGYIANLFPGESTITATFSGTEHSALAVEVFAPLTGVGTPAPINVVATGHENQVVVSWQDASGGAATSYTLYRSTNGAGFSSLATLNGNASTNYTDSAVTEWTTYYYVVTATGPNGTSLFSTPAASATPSGPPGPTTGVTATNGVYSVLLSWNGLGATNFNVWRATNTATTFGLVANVNGNAYTNPGTEGTLYYYEIQPVNFFATGSVSSVVSGVPYVTMFTNWISIPVDNTCTNGWLSGPGVADGQYFAGSPPVPPPPSQGYLVLDAYFGPGALNDFNGLHTNLPSLNLSTYTEMQLDIQPIGFDNAFSPEIQAIQLSLVCGGTSYQFYNAPGTAANNFDGMTPQGNIVMTEAAEPSSANYHYACPMNSLTNANTKAVTSLQLAILDSLNTATSNEMDVGFANIEFDGAAGYLPVYTVPANPGVAHGAPSVTLTGTVGATVPAVVGVPFYLVQGTPVNVTVAGGTTQSTTISDSTGDFSIVYTLPALANGNYQITYTTPSDNVTFVAGTNNATQLTVGVSPVPPPVIPAVKLNAAGNALLVTPGGATSSGHTYYLLQTTNLNPPVVWTTNTSFAGTGAPVTNSVPINSAKDMYLKYQVN
ncbi:MAG: hypothetical protein ABSE16_14475 [Verrucomicrobiota bacterium]|jgi:hypothetical protein